MRHDELAQIRARVNDGEGTPLDAALLLEEIDRLREGKAALEALARLAASTEPLVGVRTGTVCACCQVYKTNQEWMTTRNGQPFPHAEGCPFLMAGRLVGPMLTDRMTG